MNPNQKSPRNASANTSAFTLIEIMVVLGVVALIAVMAVPALNGVMKGSKMTTSADQFESDLARAQAAAYRENLPIEFRFYYYRDPEQPGTSEAYRAYQAVLRKRKSDDIRATEEVIPIFDVRTLPPGVIFSSDNDYSTMLAIRDPDDNLAKDHGTYDDSIPRVDSAEFKSFHFRPDGSTDLVSFGTKLWCVTLIRETAEGKDDLPPDFVTFQVDAYNGQVRRYEKGF